MKFLCEQCKAKYQIGDDKVAGKTVRMKCRKCGHLIEVRAAVTETSVAAAPRDPDLSKRAILAAPPPASRPMAARTPALGSSLGASVSAASKLRPRTEHPAAAAGALEGAFRSSVQHAREDEVSASFDMSELSANDEWYVAINGVPVGPIRIAEVRRKAALGAVTEDSLCWQEGLDEWRPLRSFPELAATVREAMTSSRLSRPPGADGRTSSLPPPPPARSAPPRQPAPLAPPPPRAGVSRAIPAGTPPPQARSNVVPLLSKFATAEKLDEHPGRTSPVPGVPLLPPPAPIPLLPVAADPFPAARAAEPLAPAAASTASALASAPPSRGRKTTPWMALMMVALAGAFGITAALVLLLRPAAAPAPPATSAEANPTSAGATLSASSAAIAPPPSAALPAPAAAAAPAALATAAPKPKPAAKAAGATVPAGGAPSAGESTGSPGGRTLDLHGLAQNAPTISPTDDPGNDPGAKAAGQCLSEGAIQQVLLTHKPGLTRGCWERNPSNKMSVSVNVSMTIGPDGRPQNVSASGDDPSVAKCIENDVRGWHFPAAGCSQATQIPFKFVKQ